MSIAEIAKNYQLYDAGTVCLLRVAEPEKRGDRIGRFTALEAEQLLLQSNERCEQLAEQSRTFVWEVDASGLYAFVGESVSPVLG